MEGKIDTFANRLLIAMNENKLNQVELAEKTNCCEKPISQSLINKYLKGKAFARQNNLYILAKILNVDEAWLMGYDVPKERKNNLSDVRMASYNSIDTDGLDEDDIAEINLFIEKFIKPRKEKNK